MKEAGLNRINISLDSINKDNFNKITNTKFYDKVIESIDKVVEVFKTVKINVCVTNDNIDEIPNFINFSSDRKSQVIIKFLELVPCGNEHQQNENLFHNCFVSNDNIKSIIEQEFGKIDLTEKTPNSRQKCRYYKIAKNGVCFGLNPNLSINYQCQRTKCIDFRINPLGYMSDCTVNLKNLINLRDYDFPEKVKAISQLVCKKKSRSSEEWETYIHKQRFYDFWRGGVALKT